MSWKSVIVSANLVYHQLFLCKRPDSKTRWEKRMKGRRRLLWAICKACVSDPCPLIRPQPYKYQLCSTLCCTTCWELQVHCSWYIIYVWDVNLKTVVLGVFLFLFRAKCHWRSWIWGQWRFSCAACWRDKDTETVSAGCPSILTNSRSFYNFNQIYCVACAHQDCYTQDYLPT